MPAALVLGARVSAFIPVAIIRGSVVPATHPPRLRAFA
jgi:hypothetical protein